MKARSAWPGVDLDEATFDRWVRARPEATQLDELYLCCACLEGKPLALERFEASYFPALKATLARFKVNADDVLQELREHLFLGSAKLATYSGRGGLHRWLRAVVVRLALKRQTRAGPEHVTLGADDFLVSEDPALAHLKDTYRLEFKKALDGALSRLEPELQSCLRLYYVDGLGLAELATLYQSSAPTMSRRLARARAEVLEGTLATLRQTLRVSPEELSSILRLIDSQLSLTFGALEG